MSGADRGTSEPFGADGGPSERTACLPAFLLKPGPCFDPGHLPRFSSARARDPFRPRTTPEDPRAAQDHFQKPQEWSQTTPRGSESSPRPPSDAPRVAYDHAQVPQEQAKTVHGGPERSPGLPLKARQPQDLHACADMYTHICPYTYGLKH